jgi:hypothetical protein
MKRNWGLIRLLLQETEAGEPPAELSQYSKEEQLYHAVLLIEGGLVHGTVIPDQDGHPISARISGMTWEGHDFVEATKDSALWSKAVQACQAAGISATAEILVNACKLIAKHGYDAALKLISGSP